MLLINLGDFLSHRGTPHHDYIVNTTTLVLWPVFWPNRNVKSLIYFILRTFCYDHLLKTPQFYGPKMLVFSWGSTVFSCISKSAKTRLCRPRPYCYSGPQTELAWLLYRRRGLWTNVINPFSNLPSFTQVPVSIVSSSLIDELSVFKHPCTTSTV